MLFAICKHVANYTFNDAKKHGKLSFQQKQYVKRPQKNKTNYIVFYTWKMSFQYKVYKKKAAKRTQENKITYSNFTTI